MISKTLAKKMLKFSFVVYPNRFGNDLEYRQRAMAYPNIGFDEYARGFFLEGGLFAVIYDEENSGFLEAGHHEFIASCYSETDGQISLWMRVVSDKNGNIARRGNYVLCRVLTDASALDHASLKFRSTPLKVGDDVYTYQCVNSQWSLCAGKIYGTKGNKITTTINTYHGACGSLLFDGSGYGIAIGATIDFKKFVNFVGIRRAYKFSDWDHVNLIKQQFREYL